MQGEPKGKNQAKLRSCLHYPGHVFAQAIVCETNYVQPKDNKLIVRPTEDDNTDCDTNIADSVLMQDPALQGECLIENGHVGNDFM